MFFRSVRNSFIFLIIAFFLCAGCQPRLYTETEFLMGTFVEVTSSDPRAAEIVFKEFKRLEDIFSLYNEESELSRLNAAGNMVVSPELFEVIKKARDIYDLSGGAYDVTVAPLALLWKKAIRDSEFPPDASIKAARALVGFDYVRLDNKTQTVWIFKSGAKIDLSSLAKGYAVDSAVAKLKKAGINSAIVNGGGDLYCLGENHKRLWSVGIRDPRSDKKVIKRIKLKDEAVATSGDYEQFFVFKNKRYSHIINPKTGYPADSGILSATVIAPDAMTADALATALVVLGTVEGEAFLSHFKGIRAELFDNNGSLHEL